MKDFHFERLKKVMLEMHVIPKFYRLALPLTVSEISANLWFWKKNFLTSLNFIFFKNLNLFLNFGKKMKFNCFFKFNFL